MPELLNVNDLCLSFGDADPVVDGLSFSVAPGESVGLIGPSGSGKSITTHALLGLLPPGGRIRRGGAAFLRKNGHYINLLEASERDRHAIRGREIGLIFQEPQSALNPVISCGRQLREAVRQLDGGGDTEETVDDLLRQVGLFDLRRRVERALPGELSGGQLQRVVIAMALAGRPRLLIADEPTTALDSLTEREIVVLLDDLRRRRGMGLLFISHDEGLITRITDRQVVLAAARPAAGVGAGAGVVKPRVAASLDRSPIAVRGLTVTYAAADIPAVSDCSFEIAPGSWVGLIGPSGCGKSTVANWLVGLVRARSGEFRVGGRTLSATADGPEIRHATGAQVIFQDVYGSLNPRLKVGEAVREVAGWRRGAAEMKELLASVGLPADEYAGKYPSQLSGGQRQRVAIARALAAGPRLLICDEALSGLDLPLRLEVRNLLKTVSRARGISVLLITHDLRTARDCTDTILLMDQGRIVEAGPSSRVLYAPQSTLGRRFVDALV